MDFIMLRKHALLAISLLSSITLYAVPIESNSLSGSTASNIGNSNSPINGNMNWDLLQKNQNLENQVRELRGKIEEQDYAIEQLTKELTSKYTDLDQRLELLNQRLDPDSDTQQEATTESQTGAAQEPASNAQQTIPLSPIPTVPNK